MVSRPDAANNGEQRERGEHDDGRNIPVGRHSLAASITLTVAFPLPHDDWRETGHRAPLARRLRSQRRSTECVPMEPTDRLPWRLRGRRPRRESLGIGDDRQAPTGGDICNCGPRDDTGAQWIENLDVLRVHANQWGPKDRVGCESHECHSGSGSEQNIRVPPREERELGNKADSHHQDAHCASESRSEHRFLRTNSHCPIVAHKDRTLF
jgi:hypothetical protein